MAKKTLPSYHPAFTAPRRAVGRVDMVGCLNWSRPFVYPYVSIGIEKRGVIEKRGFFYGEWLSVPCVPEQARRVLRLLRGGRGVCWWLWTPLSF
jgi:hypothetical protein